MAIVDPPRIKPGGTNKIIKGCADPGISGIPRQDHGNKTDGKPCCGKGQQKEAPGALKSKLSEIYKQTKGTGKPRTIKDHIWKKA